MLVQRGAERHRRRPRVRELRVDMIPVQLPCSLDHVKVALKFGTRFRAYGSRARV